MADRYWVGGTASWDGTAGTKWATTSGGAGGASVPTTADDVFFSAASTGTVTISTGNLGAKSINCTGFTGTLAGSAAISVAGSVTLVAGMGFTYFGVLTFTATATLTTAGKTIRDITINTAGITVTLGDAFNSNGTLTVSRGTFDTANYSVTLANIISNATTNRTITLGSSTVTVTSTSGIAFVGVGLTFNAGTSQVNLSSSGAQLLGNGVTFYNVTFTSTTTGTATRAITGANTFNNLALSSNPANAGIVQLEIDGNQIVNGTLTCAGADSLSRCFVQSSVAGTSRTITAAAISANDCDFRDITLAGAAAGVAPTRAGDCGGNSGITFPAPKTVYRVGINTTWAGGSSWALTSGGSGSDANFPLAQDTCIINNDTLLSGTLTMTLYNVGTLSCANRTNAITLSHNTIYRYGSYILSSSVTITSTGTQTFFGRGTMDFISAGKVPPFPVSVNAPGGTFRLGDAFNSTSSLTLLQGTLDSNNYNVTAASFNASTSNVRTVTMGSGLWTLTGTGTVWNISISSNLTFNKNTANILLNVSSTASFASGPLTYNKLTIGGGAATSTVTINSTVGSVSGSFSELASTRTGSYTVSMGNSNALSGAVIGTWSITGSPGNIVSIVSPTAGSRRSFTLTNVTSGIDYLSVTDIGEQSGNKFYVGANSIDGGNNSNVYFTAPPSASATGNMLMLF